MYSVAIYLIDRAYGGPEEGVGGIPTASLMKVWFTTRNILRIIKRQINIPKCFMI